MPGKVNLSLLVVPQKIIINKVNEFLMQGFENIILVGHSAGAWASLNLQSRFPKKIDGVIAFNPAFTGTKKNKGKTKQKFRPPSAAISMVAKQGGIISGGGRDNFKKSQG